MNRPRSIYQYSNMAPRLSGQTSIFGVVFFVSKSPLGIDRQKKLEKFAIFTRKPRNHVRILTHRTWPIETNSRSTVRPNSCETFQSFLFMLFLHAFYNVLRPFFAFSYFTYFYIFVLYLYLCKILIFNFKLHNDRKAWRFYR